jgi:hypothetical protein
VEGNRRRRTYRKTEVDRETWLLVTHIKQKHLRKNKKRN